MAVVIGRVCFIVMGALNDNKGQKMKVYIVKDYDGVLGAYSTKKNAEYAKIVFNNDHEIEEIEIDALPNHPQGMLGYCVLIGHDGIAGNVHRTCASTINEITSGWGKGTQSDCFYMFAKDEKDAVEIAFKRRAQLIENGEMSFAPNILGNILEGADWKQTK